MFWKAIGVAAVIPLAVTMGDCAAPSPETCRIDHTGTTIAAGVIGGALHSGGHSLEWPHGSGDRLAGALVGGVIAAVVAHERDKACHDLALKEALDQAVIVNEGIQSRTPAPSASETAQSPTTSAAVKAPAEPAKTPAYQTVAWANSMTSHTGSITPLVAEADSPKDQLCMTYADQQLVDGKMQTLTDKACRGADGKWKPIGA